MTSPRRILTIAVLLVSGFMSASDTPELVTPTDGTSNQGEWVIAREQCVLGERPAAMGSPFQQSFFSDLNATSGDASGIHRSRKRPSDRKSVLLVFRN